MPNPKSDLYRELFANSHEWLEGTIADVTTSQASWQPSGRAVPIGAHYVHHLISEDAFIQNVFQGQPPVMAGDFAGTAGFNEQMPMGDWSEWARRVTVDLPAARAYAQAVYAATDSYLAGITQQELDRDIDLSEMGMTTMKLSYWLNQILTNAALHCGEISCIKGLQEQRGYPF